MKNFKELLLLSLSAFLFLTACEKEDPINPDNNTITYENGIFIACEGGFGSNNATVHFIDPGTVTLFPQIFRSSNAEDLGDVLQSITFHNDQAYLVMNGSGKISEVQQSNFEKAGEITGLSSPRYLNIEGSTGYVTNLYSPYIQVVDLTSRTVVDSIDLGEQSDQSILNGDLLWIISPKEWQGRDKNHIYTANTSDGSIDSLAVGYNPSEMVYDNANQLLYVYCSGKEDGSGSEGAVLVTVDVQDGSILHTLELGYTNQGSLMALDALNQRILLSQTDGIYSYSLSSQFLSATPIISLSDVTYLYALDVSPFTGEIFIGDAKDFASAGEIRIYSADGILTIQNPMDIAPNGFYFE